mmetsp:Transcript_55291/g.140239  ORF Transcript_55291/g.140239 Transcript_55291/m.140239 type:complete len:648 (+) Transcript_55291:70-2013(+)
MQRCPSCNSTALVQNSARGDTICASCGEVVEENTLVTEVAFAAGAGGKKSLAGTAHQFLNLGRPGFLGQISPHSEASVQKGLTRLNQLCEHMHLNIHVREAGRRMYQLAWQMNFIAGRPKTLVAAACLYTICRRNKSPHLMIDFSDALRVPVVKIGRTYLRLMRRLTGGDPRSPGSLVDPGAAELPIIDPSLFVERFARRLDMGHQQRQVQNTAVKLIQFMHRDWICLGRRPNGLCGAALLIASFYHGLKHDAATISKVVRIGEDTLRKRLQELQHTQLATMSRKDFERIDPRAIQDAPAETLSLPPCMRQSKDREERRAILDADMAAARREMGALADGSAQKASSSSGSGQLCLPSSGSSGGVAAAMPPPSAPPRRGRRRRVGDDDESGGSEAPASPAASAAEPPSATAADIGAGTLVASSDTTRDERFTSRDPTPADINQAAQDIASELKISGIMAPQSGDLAGELPADFAAATERIDDLLAGRKDFAALPLVPTKSKDNGARGQLSRPAPATPIAASQCGDENSDQEETFSEVDEAEMDEYLLDEEQKISKATVWADVNTEYLEELHNRSIEAKKRKERKDKATTSDAGSETASNTGSQGSRSRKSWRPHASSCVESTVLALQKKARISPSMINMDVLKGLFDE